MMTSSRTINYAIIGTGSITETHIHALAYIPQAEVVGLVSRSEERAQAASIKWGIPTYTSLEKLTSAQRVDAVIICTPTGWHLEGTKEAARLGLHIIVEKPLETTAIRAQDMIDICAQENVSLSCIFQNRWSTDFQKLKKACDMGEFGKLLLGNAYIKWYRDPDYYQSSTWKGTITGDGGAALINQGIHTVDLLLDIMGTPISVIGKTRTTIHDIEGEDVAVGILSFQNGGMATIEASTAIHPGYPERLEIHGSKGGAVLEGGKLISWKGEPTDTSASLYSGAMDPKAIGYDLHRKQLTTITDSLLQGTVPPVTSKSALVSLQVINALYDSASTGVEVFL